MLVNHCMGMHGRREGPEAVPEILRPARSIPNAVVGAMVRVKPPRIISAMPSGKFVGAVKAIPASTAAVARQDRKAARQPNVPATQPVISHLISMTKPTKMPKMPKAHPRSGRGHY